MDGGHILLPKIPIYKNRTKQTDQNMSELYSYQPLNDTVKSLNSIFNSEQYVFPIKTT